jgi:hypothetical protein
VQPLYHDAPTLAWISMNFLNVLKLFFDYGKPKDNQIVTTLRSLSLSYSIHPHALKE